MAFTIYLVLCNNRLYTLILNVDVRLYIYCYFILEYNPKRFQAVIMRIRDPKTTALIFHSGKMIVTGAKTEEDSKLASKKYTIIIQKVGIPATYNRYTIQNMTATCDVDFPIRLEGLIMNHAANATYEPELFPGLIYRVPDSKTVILIFVSGKLVLTGAKSVGSLTTALENIFPILEEFKKKLNVRGIANSSK